MIEILLALAALVLALIVPVLLNRVPLAAPPGPLRRLATYLGSNVVETVDDSEFPERHLASFRADPDRAFVAAREAANSLGWVLEYDNPSQLEFNAVVTTPLLRFRDDVKVKILPTTDPAVVQLYLRSRSRLGKGDLGANTRHLLDFYAALTLRADRLLH